MRAQPGAEPGAEPAAPEVALVTGLSSPLARRLARALLDRGPETRLYLVVPPPARAAVEAMRAELEAARPGVGGRLTLLDGDAADIDLGLSGAEYRALAAEVTAIYHLPTAAPRPEGGRRAAGLAAIVEGTRSMLELAGEAPRLLRMSLLSSASVSGTRSGVVLEEELDEGQRFRHPEEEARFHAEKLAQSARRRLPLTVLRPGEIVGDSHSGVLERDPAAGAPYSGPEMLMALLVTSPVDVPLPLPGRGEAPLHLVPIDFVVEAALALSHDPRAVGRTFHLTDPNPLAARTVFRLVAERAERKPPRGTIPTALARALLRAPGVSAIARAPLSFLESFNQVTLYNCRHTLALLEGTGIRCPPFDHYVDPLVQALRGARQARQQADEEVADPFE